MKINLLEADDGLEGRWWNRIRSYDFGFASSIPDISEAEAEEGDIFIHKQVMEGERFPTVRYHTVIDSELIMIDGKEARQQLADALIDFFSREGKLPFACTFQKIQKNKMVVFKYSPTSFDSFQIKCKLSDFPIPGLDDKEEDLEEIKSFFLSLESVKRNPLASEDEMETIAPLTSSPVIEKVAQENPQQRVYIHDATIEEINKRKSVFQGYENTFYLLKIKGGKASSDNKKSTLKRDFDVINAKCSKNVFEKYDLKVGDVVSFSGRLKEDRNLGLILHNIRKFTKT